MFSPLCLSKQCSAADVALALKYVLAAMHYVSVLCITQRRLHVGGLWTTHYVSVYESSAESPPERAMDYALPAHYVSVLCITQPSLHVGGLMDYVLCV